MTNRKKRMGELSKAIKLEFYEPEKGNSRFKIQGFKIWLKDIVWVNECFLGMFGILDFFVNFGRLSRYMLLVHFNPGGIFFNVLTKIVTMKENSKKPSWGGDCRRRDWYDVILGISYFGFDIKILNDVYHTYPPKNGCISMNLSYI